MTSSITYTSKTESKLGVVYRMSEAGAYSGVKGALKVEGTFKFKRCINDVVNRDAEAGLNDGIERVESFIYLGDKLNVGGGCLSAMTAGSVWNG